MEEIEVQNSLNSNKWPPYVGDETYELLRSKGFTSDSGKLNESGRKILDETIRIMQACTNPASPESNNTGIVIGYIQSGKTLSFTTLAALARDNNYQVIILMGGTTRNLLEQSTARLIKDLRIDTRYAFSQKWTLITNPERNEDYDTISTALSQWADKTYSKEYCRTILITVMKNGNRLYNLTRLLTSLNLTSVPTLIIDDEGDQASLNTRAAWAARQGLDIETLTENEVSTIYIRINQLRNIFHNHTFLQYTATPQANLFINIIDRLSPNFIKLLTPGDTYTGGKTFFHDNPNLIIEIPTNDLSPLQEPPNSLLKALRMFYLGVTAGFILESYKLPGQHNRSMLIHPSRLQANHVTYVNWINNIKESWQRLLSGTEKDEKEELIDEFRSAYNELKITVTNLPSFDLLCGINLIHAIQYTPVVEVNSRVGSMPQIIWQSNYSWILVGGQSMDRGFTVEGLTVTYMPRNIGVGNVDTIQQRARFFGYKRNYLGYCRVFLDQVTIDAYNSIIEHEENVRAQLFAFDINNKNLNDWDRRVVLDSMLNLTRANVLYDALDRDTFGAEWFRINSPHDTEEFIKTNRETIYKYLKTIEQKFTQDIGSNERTEEQRHLMATVSISDCLNNLLNDLRFTKESDSAAYSSIRGILKRFISENKDENCLIYLMSARRLDNWTRRVRKLDKNNEILQLFQGRNPRTGNPIYPGDIEIKNENMLCIQIHMLNLRDSYENVPTLAIWVPEHMGTDIIRQS